MIVGIDPGVSGGIGFVKPDGTFWKCEHLPTMTVGTGKAKGKRKINAAELCRLLEAEQVTLCLIEKVASMPKQGVASVFSFGYSAGIIEGVVASLGIPYDFVTPQRWRKHYSLIKSEKDASRAKAQQLFPDAPLGLKKDHGPAEALLIARYGATQGK